MTLSDNGSPVTWHAEGGVLEIVLDRPPANALGLPIVEGLHAGLNAAKRLPAKVIVVSSALPGFFAAGADIKHMSSIDAESFGAYGDALRGAVERLAAHPAVSVAAVDGLALRVVCDHVGKPHVGSQLVIGFGGVMRRDCARESSGKPPPVQEESP